MNPALYFVCLALMLPIAGFAIFGFVIDSLIQHGLWECLKVLFGPLFDPFGTGRWFFLFLLGFVGLCGIGFFPEYQPFGLGVLALAGTGCTIYVIRVYPNWQVGTIPILLPGTVGIGLSVYYLVRPIL